MSERRIKVGVLAGTGAVGQRFVSLLDGHPWIDVVAVTGSQRSAGRKYGEAVNWVVPGDVPHSVRDLVVQENDAGALSDADVLFSALPSKVAKDIEPQLAAAGFAICSNASAYRMAPDVPLLIPEVNPDHVGLIDVQRKNRGWDGFITTCANCSSTGIMLPLKALHDAFGLVRLHVATMQAVSGAGYPGVASLDIVDNVLPYIGGEEDKIETEPNKMLGAFTGTDIEPAAFVTSAQTHRVPVIDGHLAAVSTEFASVTNIEGVKDALRDFCPPDLVRDLPSAPEKAMILHDEPDRPQPRRDRDAGNGMTISVGRVQACPVLGYKFISLVHNTIRGAAGGAILNAELLVATGYI